MTNDLGIFGRDIPEDATDSDELELDLEPEFKDEILAVIKEAYTEGAETGLNRGSYSQARAVIYMLDHGVSVEDIRKGCQMVVDETVKSMDPELVVGIDNLLKRMHP